MPDGEEPLGQQSEASQPASANASEAYRRNYAYLETHLWEQSGTVSKQEDEYYTSPPKWRWFWKTPVYTFGCGITALVGILGQFAVPTLDRAFGQPLADNVDLLRAIMLFSGFLLLMIASPVYRSADWKPADDVKNLIDRENFRSKFKR